MKANRNRGARVETLSLRKLASAYFYDDPLLAIFTVATAVFTVACFVLAAKSA